MHKFSAFLFKRPTDSKHSDVDEDTPSHVHEHLNGRRRSFQTPPRLVRSPGIRGLRNPEDVEISAISLNGTDHSLESASSLPPSNLSGLHPTSNLSGLHATSNSSSVYSNNVKMASPLPSPPRSPIQGPVETSSLWPLPSPRPLPKKNEENLNGSPLEHIENDHGVPSYLLEGEMRKSLATMIPTENHERFYSPSGATVLSSPRVGGKGSGTSGGGLPSRNAKSGGREDVHAHVYTKQVEPSSPIGRFLNPVRSPYESGNQRDTWHWKPEQVFHGDTTAADESSGAEYSHHMANYSHQIGASSRDVGYSRRHPQTVGSPPTASSPPLSPSAARGLSSGRWQKGHLLGSGAFGKVYKGIHSGTGEFCAIKEVEFVQNDRRSKEAAIQLKKEIASLSTLQHPNIVQYKGSELVGDSLHIYLELISGGSLHKLSHEFKLEEPVIRRYTKQILLGLQYLHNRRFVHRDIKCANILVDQDGRIKLADFGVAKHIKEQGVPFSLKGSPHWMAPEVIMSENTGYEYAVDIWSLGCTVIEMVNGKPPWSELEAAAAMFKVLKVGAPPIPEVLSPDGQNFVKLCLQRNPADRPTAAELLEHRFVQIQGEANHTMVHAFDALRTLDLGEAPASFASGMHPSLSAPSSPPSSHRPVYELNPTRSGPMSRDTDLPGAKFEQNRAFGNSSTPPRKRSGRPRNTIPSSGNRRSNKFTQTQARPLSAPGSPKSSHNMYGNLHPTRSAEHLPGLRTPFSEHRASPLHERRGSPMHESRGSPLHESRGSPLHDSEFGQGFTPSGRFG
eukprot:c16822_g1_i1 orf=237-2606(+)